MGGGLSFFEEETMGEFENLGIGEWESGCSTVNLKLKNTPAHNTIEQNTITVR